MEAGEIKNKYDDNTLYVIIDEYGVSGNGVNINGKKQRAPYDANGWFSELRARQNCISFGWEKQDAKSLYTICNDEKITNKLDILQSNTLSKYNKIVLFDMTHSWSLRKVTMLGNIPKRGEILGKLINKCENVNNVKIISTACWGGKKNANNDYRCEIYNVLKNVNKNNISVECQFTPPNDYATNFFCDNNGKIHVLYSQYNKNIQDYEYSDTYLFKKENNNIKIAHRHLPYPFNLSSKEQTQINDNWFKNPFQSNTTQNLKRNIINAKVNNFKADTSYENFIANPPYQTFKELYESLQGTDPIKDARTDKIIQEGKEIIKKNEDEEKKKLIPKEFMDCFDKPPNWYLKSFISYKKNESGFIFKKFNDDKINEFLRQRVNNLFLEPKTELKIDFPNTNKYVVINYEYDSTEMKTFYTLTFVDYNDKKNGHYLRIEGYYDADTEKCVLTEDIFYTKGDISQYLLPKVKQPPKVETKKVDPPKNEDKKKKEEEDKQKKIEMMKKKELEKKQKEDEEKMKAEQKKKEEEEKQKKIDEEKMKKEEEDKQKKIEMMKKKELEKKQKEDEEKMKAEQKKKEEEDKQKKIEMMKKIKAEKINDPPKVEEPPEEEKKLEEQINSLESLIQNFNNQLNNIQAMINDINNTKNNNRAKYDINKTEKIENIINNAIDNYKNNLETLDLDNLDGKNEQEITDITSEIQQIIINAKNDISELISFINLLNKNPASIKPVVHKIKNNKTIKPLTSAEKVKQFLEQQQKIKEEKDKNNSYDDNFINNNFNNNFVPNNNIIPNQNVMQNRNTLLRNNNINLQKQKLNRNIELESNEQKIISLSDNNDNDNDKSQQQQQQQQQQEQEQDKEKHIGKKPQYTGKDIALIIACIILIFLFWIAWKKIRNKQKEKREYKEKEKAFEEKLKNTINNNLYSINNNNQNSINI